MRTEPKSYFFAADLLRALAAIAVIVLHAMDAVYLRPDFFGGKVWWITHLIGILCRSAVPLFIMLSGYLTLNRGKTIQTMWQKTWSRIILPGVSAFALYFSFDLIAGRLTGTPWQIMTTFFDRLNTNSSTHLFFLIILFYLYLATPILDSIFSYTRRIQRKVIAFFFGLTVLSLLANFTTFASDNNIYNTYTTWIFYIGYFLFGYYLKDMTWSAWREKISFLLFGAAYAVGVLGSYFAFAQQGSITITSAPYFLNYFSANILLQSVCLFALAMKSSVATYLQKYSPLRVGIQVVAAQSFGLYLYHLLVMYILDLNVNLSPSGGLIPFLALSILAIFLQTLLIVVWLRRGFFKFLLGE